MSDNIAEKLVIEALSKLPIDQLVSFKGVPKSVIESPDFIKMQLAQAMENTSNHCLILSSSNGHPHSADFDSVNNHVVFQELLDCPVTLWGSCNGLLCLSVDNDAIFLWNPLDKMLKKLPDEKIDPQFTELQLMDSLYGFGYDSVNDDYKVLRITRFRGFCNKDVKVYSLKRDSWKSVSNFTNSIDSEKGVLANDALHWVVYVRELTNIYGVASFDLATEEFMPVPMPPFSERRFHLDLGVLRGCLCVVAKYNKHKTADVWVRKKNGVEYIWTKLVTIIMPDLDPDEPVPLLSPIAYSNCGKRLLFKKDLNLLAWYDLEETSATYVNVVTSDGDDFNDFELDICVHSLVQPNSGNPIKNRRRYNN